MAELPGSLAAIPPPPGAEPDRFEQALDELAEQLKQRLSEGIDRFADRLEERCRRGAAELGDALEAGVRAHPLRAAAIIAVILGAAWFASRRG